MKNHSNENSEFKITYRSKFIRGYFLIAILALLLLTPASFSLAFNGSNLTDHKPATDSDNEENVNMKSGKMPRVRAPELEGGHGWLNTEKPLKISELRGKIVILDFWTYCCINCMHIIPELKKLEAKYANQLVVIGVHSAKFNNEKESDNIRQAILRYEIEHPVVNDSDFEIWQSYTVRAWPTLVLIDPEGYVINNYPGEGNFAELDAQINSLIEDFRTKKKLNEKPIKQFLEKDRITDNQALSFPGKILADQAGQRLFISDSNHNRIVITSLEGKLIDTIGTGRIGKDDGDFTTASFNHPQGTTLSADGKTLYIADTENHLIRRVDLTTKKVETIAGIGEQSRRFSEFGVAKTVALNSPWDLKVIQRYLFIAMAGPHQIWIMDLETNKIGPFAGSGMEGHQDGPRHRAALAQPSGLAYNGGNVLFVADSEISSIRAIDIRDEGEVYSVVGSGSLFGFGDIDGETDTVRLQHPLGVDYLEGKLYVADTYNHKIKIVDLTNGSCKSLFGDGKPGRTDGKNARLYEPGGISILGDKLYIADTNNHAIRVANLKTNEISTLKIEGLTASPIGKTPEILPNREDVKVSAIKVAPGKGELILDLKLPNNFHLNAESTQRYEIKSLKGDIVIDDAVRKGDLKKPSLPIKVPFQIKDQEKELTLEVALTFYYCPINDSGACKIKSVVWNVPIEIEKSLKDSDVKLSYEVKE